MFTLLICCDIVGHKINCEVPFQSPPTLAEIRQRADLIFYEEAMALQRAGRLTPAASELLAKTVVAPGFDGRGQYQDSGMLSLNRIQVYDDSLLKWVDLIGVGQLFEYSQLYIYPKHRSHLSQQTDLPPPKQTGAALARREVGDAHYSGVLGTSTVASTAVSHNNNSNLLGTRSAASPSRYLVPPNQNNNSAVAGAAGSYSPSRFARSGNEFDAQARAIAAVDQSRPFDLGVEELDRRQRAVFQVADRNSNSYLSVEDFRSLIMRTKILFNDVTITELFAIHSANGKFLSFQEWQQVTRSYPQLFAAMYRRLMDTQTETDMSNELELGAKRLVGMRAEVEELARRLAQLKGEIVSQEGRSKEIADRLAAARVGRVPVEEEEQVVLEKEVRIRFQREMLLREETELQEASRRLDQRTSNNVRRF